MKVHAAIPLQKKAIAILGRMHRDTGSNNSGSDTLWQDCHCSATCCLRPITQKTGEKKEKNSFLTKNLTPGVEEEAIKGDDTQHNLWSESKHL